MKDQTLEQLLDLLSGQGAAVSEFTSLDRFQLFAQFGSGSEFEFGRVDGGVLVEQANDNVVFGFLERSSGQITDQTAITLSGFLSGQNCECGVIRSVSGTSVSAGCSDGKGS